MNIGSAIKLARKNLNLTQKELAKNAALSPSTIARIENGERSLSIQSAQDIAKALGMQLSDLIIVAESILKPEDEIKKLQSKLLLLVQPILSKRKPEVSARHKQTTPKPTPSKSSATESQLSVQ